VISRIGTILVDGKVYPPAVAGQNAGPSVTPPAVPANLSMIGSQPPSSRQRQSPNVTPPLRPLLPGGIPNTGYNTNNNSSSNSNNPSLYSSQYPAGMRSYPNENPPRFPMSHPSSSAASSMKPPAQPHVSSSTHPNNMGNGEMRRAKVFVISLLTLQHFR